MMLALINDADSKWDVIDRKNGHHSILNVRYPRQYAVSGYRSKVEEQVTGEESDQTWLIKPSSKGQYTFVFIMIKVPVYEVGH